MIRNVCQICNVGWEEMIRKVWAVTGFGGKHGDLYCYAREFIWNVENVWNTNTNWAEPEVQTKPKINAFFKFSPQEMGTR